MLFSVTSSVQMSGSWLSLPRSWRLEDVQAVLNIIVSVLSTLGAFVFARICWQTTAAKVAKNRNVSLSALLSLSSLGEVFDIAVLLRTRLLAGRYSKILIQCIVVACFSATAILSGPIARYSTRRGHIVSSLDVPGSLVTDYYTSINFANVEWNLTQTSLDQAGFPRNQLLDFLPDTATAWVYREEEWNSTWTMNCNHTNVTPITLNVSNDNCTSLYTEMPGLNEILNPNDYYYHYWTHTGLFVNYTRWKDQLLFIVGTQYQDYDNDTGITYAMSVSVAAVHLHNLTKSNNTSDCDFGPGPVQRASYTKADCQLHRRRHIPDDYHLAYPDTDDVGSIVDAYVTNYAARFVRESASDSNITVLEPTELVRFFQAYVLVKDTQFQQPVTRRLSVDIVVVQLSAVFLAFAIVAALLILSGLASYSWFLLSHRSLASCIPLGKLDWMLQSIQCGTPWQPGEPDRPRRCVISELEEEHVHLPRHQRMIAEFEHATYGDLVPASRTTDNLDEKGVAGEDPFTETEVQHEPHVEEAETQTDHGQMPSFPTNLSSVQQEEGSNGRRVRVREAGRELALTLDDCARGLFDGLAS